MRKTLGILSVLLLLAAAAAWTVASGRHRVIADGPEFGVAANRAASASHDLGAADITGATTSGGSATTSDASLERSVQSAGFVSVRAIDKVRRTVVAAARVFYVDEVGFARHRKDFGKYRHWVETVEAHGHRGRCDATGKASLPAFKRYMYVACRTADRFGYQVLNKNRIKKGRTYDIELVPDLTVTAEVEGPNGPIADFEVAMLELRGKRGSSQRAVRKTDGDGRLSIRHLQLYSGTAWALTPAAPFDPQPHVTFDREAAKRGRLKLRVPGTGSLALRLRGPSRRLLRGSARATLTVARRGKWTIGKHVMRHSALSARRDAGQDTLVFPTVGLGLRLKASVRLDGVRANASVLGPGTPGEVRKADIVFGKRTTVLAGRIAGQSLLRSVLYGPRNWSLDRSVKSVADGSFEITFDQRSDGNFELYLIARDSGRQARVALTGLRRGEHRDLGTIELTDPSLLVGGRITDDRGEPVARASLRVERLQSNRKTWKSVSFARAKSDASGVFAVAAGQLSGRLRLRCSAGGHLPRVIGFTAGQQDLRIRLDRSASVRFSIRVPTWFRDSLRAYLTRGKYARQHRIRPRGGRAAWSLTGLARGTYNLRIVLSAGLTPFAQRGIDLQVGRNDLGEIADVRERIQRYTVKAVLVDGQARVATKQRPYLLLHGGPRRRYIKRLRFGKNGQLTFAWPEQTADCEVVVRGARPLRRVISPGVSEFELALGPKIRVEAPGIRRVIGKRRAWLGLGPAPGMLKSGRLSAQALAELQNHWVPMSREGVAARVPLTGKYVVRLWVEVRTDNLYLNWSGSKGSVNQRLGTIDVGTAERYTVRFDAKALAAAIGKAKSRGW